MGDRAVLAVWLEGGLGEKMRWMAEQSAPAGRVVGGACSHSSASLLYFIRFYTYVRSYYVAKRHTYIIYIYIM